MPFTDDEKADQKEINGLGMCKRCNKIFKKSGELRKYCSHACKHEALTIQRRAAAKKQQIKKNASTELHPCEICKFKYAGKYIDNQGMIHFLCPNHRAIMTHEFLSFESLKKAPVTE